MRPRSTASRGAVLSMVVFFVVAAVLAYGTWSTLSNNLPGDTEEYSAVFTDVSGLTPGSEARIAGVPIGRVDSVHVTDSGQALVRFAIDRSVALTASTNVAVRYKDLTGRRYLSLYQPDAAPPGAALAPGATIPVARTQPALDLDQLFGSFQPLLQGLSPEQVNRLSTEFIQVLQGEGSTVLMLLEDVASFTAAIADRDEVIGEVIDNLSAGIASLDDGQGTLAASLDSAHRLVAAMNADRKVLAKGLRDTDAVAAQATDLLSALRPPLMDAADQLRRVTATVNKPANSTRLDGMMQELPKAYLRMSGAGSYGTFYNFWMCGLGLTFDELGPTVTVPMQVLDQPRCKE
ncbi:MCE family protein [Spongisporangium articulatum]|uniref:MCE family protein n=1 Tax=Spongisporangium articulatum TaxID=3362603 RepID=A0ABW8AV00_9ACTN